MSPAAPVVCLGEAMVCVRTTGRLRLAGPATVSVAGAESNVAIGLARLGHPTAMLGAVGSDELGELVVRTLRAEGVDTSGIRRDPTRATGVMFREQRTRNAVHVDYVRRGAAGSAVGPEHVADVLGALLAGPGVEHLHVSGVTWAIGAGEVAGLALRMAHASGVPTSLDVNHRARLWTAADAGKALRGVLEDVDVLFASGDEVMLVGLSPASADGPDEVVVTQGEGGAEVWTGGRQQHLAAREVTVRDVVGAGDAFVAGYLSARLDGRPVGDRLARGTDVAAVAVGSEGDWEGLPTRPELHSLFGDHGGVIR